MDRSCDFDVDIIGWQCGTPGSGPCIPLLHVCDTFEQCFLEDNSDETEGCNLYFGGEFRQGPLSWIAVSEINYENLQNVIFQNPFINKDKSVGV